MCAVGRTPGSSSSRPAGSATRGPSATGGSTEPQRLHKRRATAGDACQLATSGPPRTMPKPAAGAAT